MRGTSLTRRGPVQLDVGGPRPLPTHAVNAAGTLMTSGPNRGGQSEWRGTGNPGSAEGAWYNPKTGEYLHPDLQHPSPIGPHWDYRAPDGSLWRVYPDGRMEPK